MRNNRFSQTATLLPNGKVLVSGGGVGPFAITSAELYDPTTGMWTNTGDMNNARYQHTATLLPNGKVIVIGGSQSTMGGYLASSELYDPGMGTWTSSAQDMRMRRS